jgi:hypothetical protein
VRWCGRNRIESFAISTVWKKVGRRGSQHNEISGKHHHLWLAHVSAINDHRSLSRRSAQTKIHE